MDYTLGIFLEADIYWLLKLYGLALPEGALGDGHMRGTLRLILGVCAVFMLASQSPGEPLDAAALFSPPSIADIDLSPSGDRIAFVTLDEEAGVYRLAVMDAESDQPVLLSVAEAGFVPLWLTWATDERLLVTVAAGMNFYGYIVPTMRIMAVDSDGSDAILLFDDQPGVLRSNFNLAGITDTLRNDPDHVLMPARRGGDLDLWKVNIYSGEAERVGLGGARTIGWLADRDGEPRLRIDANRAGTVMTVYGPPGDGGDRWREIAKVREEDRAEFNPLAPANDAGSFYVIARPEGEDRAALYEFDAVSGELGRQVAAHPRVDIDGVLVDSASNTFAGYFYADDRLEYRFEDARTQAHFDGLREFFGSDTNFRIYDRSDDGQRWIVQVNGPREPGAYYLYDLAEARIVTGFAARDQVSADNLAGMSVIRYPARDGLEITGYLSLPPERDATNLPLILMPHGGPEVRDMLGFNEWAQFLASRGYAVFQPNFRGSSGYGRSFADAGHGQWGAAMQDDLIDGVNYLAGQGIVDPARVCIFGASYGGYAALAGAALTPDRYRCAISMSGVSDLEEFLRHIRRSDSFDADDYAYWVAQMGNPEIDGERLRAASPRYRLDSLRAPVLLLHGSLDGLVPVEQSQKMALAMDQAGLTYEFVPFPGVGHSGWPRDVEVDALNRIAAFLDTHLPAD